MQLTASQERGIKTFISAECAKEASEYLVTTPDAVFMTKLLALFTAYFSDVSLRSGDADEKFEHLRCPGSLRASLYQLNDGIDTVSRAAHASMGSIQDVVLQMRETVFDILNALKDTSQPDSKIILSYSIDKMKVLPMKCYDINKKIYQDICEQLEVSKELIRVATAAHGREQCRVKESVITMKGKEAEKGERQNELQRKNEEYRKQKENAENALKLLKESMERNSSFWRVLGASAIDSVTVVPRAVGGMFKAVKNIISQSREDETQATYTAMQKLDKNVEDARIHLKEEREKADALRKEAEAENEKCLQLMISMTKIDLENIDLQDLIEYLNKFCNCLTRASNAWKDWMSFWKYMCEKINDMFEHSVKDFLHYVSLGTPTPKLDALIHRYASRICAFESVLMQETELYKTISRKFIMPTLRETLDSTNLTKEKAQEIQKTLDVVKFQAGVKAEIDAHNQLLPGKVMQSLIENGYDLNDVMQ